jgi:uncharacterized protein (DUF1697 family)
MTPRDTSSASDQLTRYAAFLRGINVGGHRIIKKDELIRIFTGAGLRDVRTVIASGNVLFTTDQTDMATLTETIERALQDALGYDVTVFLRTIAQLQELVRRDPFAAIDDSDTKRYVIFLPHAPADPPTLPVHIPEESFSVLGIEGAEVLVAAAKQPTGPRYGDPTAYINKTFGKVSTSRNWNTIVKIAGL